MTLEIDNLFKFTNDKDRDEWIRRQFSRVEDELNYGREVFYLKELHVEPSKLKTGMVVLADGTDWDPGSGAGVYAYYGGSWHKLG